MRRSVLGSYRSVSGAVDVLHAAGYTSYIVHKKQVGWQMDEERALKLGLPAKVKAVVGPTYPHRVVLVEVES